MQYNTGILKLSKSSQSYYIIKDTFIENDKSVSGLAAGGKGCTYLLKLYFAGKKNRLSKERANYTATQLQIKKPDSPGIFKYLYLQSANVTIFNAISM